MPQENGPIRVERVKNSKFVGQSLLSVDGDKEQISYTKEKLSLLDLNKLPNIALKRISFSDLLELRRGYATENLKKTSTKVRDFHTKAPEKCCFSLIFRRKKILPKILDFVAETEQIASNWTSEVDKIICQNLETLNHISFNEKKWLLKKFHDADLDQNGEISYKEFCKLLKKSNFNFCSTYVWTIFKDIISQSSKGHDALNELEFIQLFETLTDLSELQNTLKIASSSGSTFLTADDVAKFLTEEQNFKNVKNSDVVKIMEEFGVQNDDEKILTVNGFRRLLQSRWGNILRENHETVFMDMDRPLHNYFIKSSHNTYICGIQVHGNATAENYINALRRGYRLLELDVFDGDDGEPIITHKMTLIKPMYLRSALKSITEYAFERNTYPVILNIENHVIKQQELMADIFEKIMGNKLYVPSSNVVEKALPSPNELKGKFLIRTKISTSPHEKIQSGDVIKKDNDDEERSFTITHPRFKKLIALQSTKLGPNLYEDSQKHSSEASPSVSENKVKAYFEAASPLSTYTAYHLVKSYPSGIRQDSSNMDPIPSILSGIQAIAMNFQTAGKNLDLINGLFMVNGNVGYVLKSEVSLDGRDPRHCTKIETTLGVAVLSGHYLPKTKSKKGIVDPYVTLEILGIPADSMKLKTKVVNNNGLNPVWKENFQFQLRCPDVAILRFSVKDFDSISTDDFLGEFSIPVNSIRSGYSILRLNTGSDHSPDDAASIFVRIAFA